MSIAPASLPSGTVTFLFTDIESSTHLLQRLGEKYPTLLAQHQQLLQEAWESHHGSVVSTQGDSFFVVFPRATDAIKAVIQAQRELAAHDWIDGVNVRVRMGLHTGEAHISAADYVGIDVHRAARIAAAAHGGQVLLSQATYHLVEGELPDGVSLLDLGEHRLKDLRQPKHLYQLVIAGLPSEFPPIRSLSTSKNNLPLQLTSFIGREKELSEIRQALGEHRLVTLTGPGGSGKTRLALQVAAEMVERFPDGVFFVALAPINDPRLVASTIAQPLGIPESAGRPVLDGLKDTLKEKTLLLLLDNFEQVIAAAPLVSDLLGVCRSLKILATSREGLHVSGEHEVMVSPLAPPNLRQLAAPESLALAALAENPAVKLFIERAQAVKPDFQITKETAAAVAEICSRLDGLPLAIELAAARVKLLPPRAMLSRLEKRLEFLTGGGRDRPARQQTLRNAIAWSYGLLDVDEQQLFRHCSVFAGGCTVDAVETVAGDSPGSRSILDLLESLLDKSLLKDVPGINDEPRFVMLETLREFGLEQLRASGEEPSVRYRHAAFFLTLAEEAESNLDSTGQVDWMNLMEQNHDNLRAALAWSRGADGAGDLCVKLAGALGRFWEARGYYSEGREQLSAILSLEMARERTAARAKLLYRAAELAYRQSDYPATTSLASESLDIYRAVGDQPGAASALVKLGNAVTEVGDYTAAVGYLESALITWRALGDQHGTARALISLGWAALRSGDYPLANRRLDEALTISRRLGDARSMGFELSGLGEVALRKGDFRRATILLEESLALRRQLGNKWGVGVSLGTLGWVAIRQKDWERATARLRESLEVRREIGDTGGCSWCLERLAEIALARGEARKAVVVFGAAAALRASIGSVIDAADQSDHEAILSALRAEESFEDWWCEGGTMTLEQACAYALEGSTFRGEGNDHDD